MLVTNHVLSGAVIGAAVRRPLPAFALGVASHFALDAAPHWGKFGNGRRYLRVAVSDGLAGLAVMAAMTALGPRGRRAAVLAGMAGAALPDLDKPSRLFFGRSPFPLPVDRFHQRIQRESAHGIRTELRAALAMVLAVRVLSWLRAVTADRLGSISAEIPAR